MKWNLYSVENPPQPVASGKTATSASQRSASWPWKSLWLLHLGSLSCWTLKHPLNLKTKTVPTFLCIRPVASISGESINKCQCAGPIGSPTCPGRKKYVWQMRWRLWVTSCFFFSSSFLLPSFWQMLIFFSSCFIGPKTLFQNSSGFCLRVSGLSFVVGVEVYQRFASCSKFSEVLVIKSCLLCQQKTSVLLDSLGSHKTPCKWF